jgi:hypothetical protein
MVVADPEWLSQCGACAGSGVVLPTPSQLFSADLCIPCNGTGSVPFFEAEAEDVAVDLQQKLQTTPRFAIYQSRVSVRELKELEKKERRGHVSFVSAVTFDMSLFGKRPI